MGSIVSKLHIDELKDLHHCLQSKIHIQMTINKNLKPFRGDSLTILPAKEGGAL